jgi:hypothetical protein
MAKVSWPISPRGVGVEQYVTKNSGDFPVHGRYTVGDRGEVSWLSAVSALNWTLRSQASPKRRLEINPL